MTISSSALAQTPPPIVFQPITTFPPGDDKIVGLKSGQSAPFDGQLFDSNTAIRWGNWMQQYQLRLKSDVELQKQTDGAEITYLTDVLQLERTKYTTVTQDYQKQITALDLQLSEATPWYKTQTFAFVMGVVCTAGAVSLGIWAFEARAK